MPFKSQAQRRWMYATHPEMAEQWSKETPKGKKLPEHVKDEKKMKVHLKVAYELGNISALEQFGIKEANMLANGANMLAKGLKWGGRAVSTAVPLLGSIPGAAMSGIGGAVQGFANGEGMKGALVRGGLNAAAGAVPGGGSLVAGVAADAAANRMMTKRPPLGPPQPPKLPGMLS